MFKRKLYVKSGGGGLILIMLVRQSKNTFIKKLKGVAAKMHAIDYSRPAHTNLPVKFKFLAVRMLQTSLGKQNPEYTDYKYWKANGWIDKVRPWR